MSQFAIWILLEGYDAAGNAVEFEYATEGLIYTPSSSGHAEGRLKVAGVHSDHMFGPARLRGEMEYSSTAIVLENRDGALDSLMNYNFDGFAAEVWAVIPAIDDTLPYHVPPLAGRLANVMSEQPVADDTAITMAIRSFRAHLDRPFMLTKYAGTNAGSPLAGIEGTAENIKGQPKPYVFGEVFNITPILVNTSKGIYQVDQRGFETGYTIAVFDKRSPLTRGADYASQADMETNVPAAGTYRVWPAGGCFRIGTFPAVGAITSDVANPILSGQPINVQWVINAILFYFVGYAGWSPLPADQHLTNNPRCGVYLDGEITMLEACNQVLASVNACLHFGADPTLAGTSQFNLTQILQLTPPGSYPYTPALNPLELDASNILEGRIQQILPGDGAGGLPVWRVLVNYKRNYTVMSAADLAGVAAADVAFCTREYRTVTAQDAAVKTQWPNAQEITVDTVLVNQTDAQAEADRLLACFKVRRQTFELRVSGAAVREHPQFTSVGSFYVGDFQIGCLVKITLNRYGLNSGKQFVVIGMERDLDADIYRLIVWG